MSVSSGTDLVLCAIDADSGQVRFGPRLPTPWRSPNWPTLKQPSGSQSARMA
jgi:hypothetical protein